MPGDGARGIGRAVERGPAAPPAPPDCRPTLSVIIPTLNAAAALPATIARLAAAEPETAIEIVISDGGSRDGTVAVARGLGARVVVSRRGRGRQLVAGAGAASGDWLLFLHADTRLDDGWGAAAARFMADPRNRTRAAAFAFALDDDSPAARRLERIVAWRTAWLGLPYGDQGLLIRREWYRRIGGHPDWPLMEDVDLVRRIGRSRLDGLAVPAVTSATRYRQSGYLARSTRNLCCLLLYYSGMPPRWIARLYG